MIKKIKRYSKNQIINSRKYSELVDVINAILADDKLYTISEVDKLILKFKKGGM